MLMIDQGLAMIGFTGLEQLRDAAKSATPQKTSGEKAACPGRACAAPSASDNSPTRPCLLPVAHPAGYRSEIKLHAPSDPNCRAWSSTNVREPMPAASYYQNRHERMATTRVTLPWSCSACFDRPVLAWTYPCCDWVPGYDLLPALARKKLSRTSRR